MTTSRPSRTDRAPAPVPAPAPASVSPSVAFVAGWLVPGAGHYLVGQTQKAVVFFVVLLGMFVIGLGLGGRLFPFPSLLADPLVFLAAAAEWVVGLPRLIGALAGAGKGAITQVTYEAGNTFLITAGLLNVLVAFNASDLARGSSRRSPGEGRTP
jgi:hypothetical protein